MCNVCTRFDNKTRVRLCMYMYVYVCICVCVCTCVCLPLSRGQKQALPVAEAVVVDALDAVEELLEVTPRLVLSVAAQAHETNKV